LEIATCAGICSLRAPWIIIGIIIARSTRITPEPIAMIPQIVNFFGLLEFFQHNIMIEI
jgi:hypothetical protein